MPANDTVLSELLDCQEASRALRLSVATLERMRIDGSGPTYLKVPPGKKRSRVLYRRSDLEAFLDACRKNSTSSKS